LPELGIDFYQIQQKTLSVLNPMKQTQPAFIAEADLAGPLVFAMLFGATMLAVRTPLYPHTERPQRPHATRHTTPPMLAVSPPPAPPPTHPPSSLCFFPCPAIDRFA